MDLSAPSKAMLGQEGLFSGSRPPPCSKQNSLSIIHHPCPHTPSPLPPTGANSASDSRAATGGEAQGSYICLKMFMAQMMVLIVPPMPPPGSPTNKF